MTLQAGALLYGVRLGVLAKHFGHLCFMLGILTLVPLGVSFLTGGGNSSFRYGVVVAALLAIGAVLSRIPEKRRIQPNEAMTLGVLMFLFSPLVMTFPMSTAGLGFMDALFETISGATTTGLTLVGNVQEMPSYFLFSRAWMQWYGGLGIVVFSVALVVQPGISARDLAVQVEGGDTLIGGTKSLFQRVLLLYGAFTAVGILALLAGGMRPLLAVTYALSAVSTGGFAASNASLGGMGLYFPLVITLLTLVCAVPLTRYVGAFFKGWREILGSLQLWGLMGLGLVVSLVFFLSLTQAELSWSERLFHGLVNGFSAQTTSGFSSVDPAALPSGSKLVMVFAMLIGGGLGSTAGGFKILRLFILIKIIRFIVIRASLARHAVYHPRLGGMRLPEREIREALVVIILYGVVVFLSWVPFLFYGYAPVDSLFEVASAVGTVGLSAGVSESGMPTLLKGVLCADMLLGRLEIVVWLIVLSPGTWIGKRSEE